MIVWLLLRRATLSVGVALAAWVVPGELAGFVGGRRTAEVET